jgi:hypothetical protein
MFPEKDRKSRIYKTVGKRWETRIILIICRPRNNLKSFNILTASLPIPSQLPWWFVRLQVVVRLHLNIVSKFEKKGHFLRFDTLLPRFHYFYNRNDFKQLIVETGVGLSAFGLLP